VISTHPPNPNLTSPTLPISIAGLEKYISVNSFEAFIEHVKILEPPPGGGVIKLEKWPHLIELVSILDSDRLISVLKSRQIGISWLIAAYVLWRALYQTGTVVFLFSQGEREAAVLLDKARFIHQHLPPYLQGVVGTDNSTEISFPLMLSKMIAFPSTEKAGRSETPTVVVQDEAEHHEHMAANFTSVKPGTDAGGQLIQISTVLKSKPNSLFKEIFRDTNNGFRKVFFGWRVRPGRDQAWYDQTYKDAPTTEEMSPDLYMEQEYPDSAEEALSPSRVMAAFNPESLKSMYEETKKPIETVGTINIYQKLVVGHRYVAFSDPSHGVGKDDAVTVVLDLETGAGVADIRGNTISPESLALDSVKLMHRYEDPLWGIEDNDWGNMVIRKAQEMEYTNLYERSKGNAGWHTGEHNRYMLWGELMEAVHTRSITVLSKVGLKQFYSVIRNPDKGGRIEAMTGTKDDYPFAFGGAWQMRKYAYDNRIIRPYRIE